ncbi:hypothetical protein SAMN05216525_104137 [Bradyrhizobium sp. Gha]|nr:hypothetical protein SAMN05216525_104137 [Bradyrhizobium sp. Gha]
MNPFLILKSPTNCRSGFARFLSCIKQGTGAVNNITMDDSPSRRAQWHCRLGSSPSA